jgi:hypothetical protein
VTDVLPAAAAVKAAPEIHRRSAVTDESLISGQPSEQ